MLLISPYAEMDHRFAYAELHKSVCTLHVAILGRALHSELPIKVLSKKILRCWFGCYFSFV